MPADRIERSASAPGDTPLVIAERIKSSLRVHALNDRAAALGLKPGLPLADARAMYPGIEVRDADRAADRALLEAVADWCDRYTPLVGLDPPDGLLLDISGCAHLFGGERALGRDMLARLSRQGFHALLGLADTAGCAWAVARYGKLHLVTQGGMRGALLPLPLAALRIDDDTIAALAQAGLKRIADVIDRPRAPLTARFGQAFLQRLDQALGREDESIKPRLPLPAYMAERRFPDPIGREDDVLGTIERLAHELGQVMERRGEGARLLQAALFRTDGKVHRIRAAASEPLIDPGRIRRLFVERLAVAGDECDPGFGYDMVRLSALTAGRLKEEQIGLSGGSHDAGLAYLIDRLNARFGARRLTRPLPRDSHIPELAVAAVPAQAAKQDTPAHIFAQDSLAPVRPVRLFARPEAIEVINEVPDGPPIRFRWRHVLHSVQAAEGPERIAFAWWEKPPGRAHARDYFRVESKEGARVWIYREGDYRRRQACWFVHGLFA